MASFAVGVAQTVPVAGDVSANIAQHLTLVQMAAELGAQTLVFPELSLTGYEMSLARQLAFTPADKRLRPLQDAARAHQMQLVVGAPLMLAEKLHIAALVLSKRGDVSVYTKQHLGTFPPAAGVDGVIPPGEPSVFSPGTITPELTIGDQPASVAICADANRPQHAAAAASRGCRTYLVSAFVIPSEFPAAFDNLQSHAREHTLTVAFSNYGGPTGGLKSAGQSAIWVNGDLPIGHIFEKGRIPRQRRNEMRRYKATKQAPVKLVGCGGSDENRSGTYAGYLSTGSAGRTPTAREIGGRVRQAAKRRCDQSPAPLASLGEQGAGVLVAACSDGHWSASKAAASGA